ncbi:MAG: hypothetical protein Q9195_009318 [Heterodermia aff. obscurata]
MANPIPAQPDYGRRLIPSLIDELAVCAPQRIYCHVPWTTRIEDGFRAVTYGCLSNAINACAWWIEAEIGKSKDFATIAYLGPSDLRNTIIIVAAIKAGHKALLASPRNSLPAHLNLLENTQCHVLMTAEHLPPLTRKILASRPMVHLIVPELAHWLDAPIADPYPYVTTFEQARYEPFVVVHTSGSTGLPKVVVVNHGTMAANDAFNEESTDETEDRLTLDVVRDKICYISLPCFHIAGIDFMLSKALFNGIIPVLGPSGPLTAEVADAMHQVKMIEISVLVPSIIQDLASSQSWLDNLCQMKAIIYGGGPLGSQTGNAIAARTRLYNSMGSSEMNYLPTEIVDREDWEYLKFSPKLGYQMQHHSGDLFELVLIRKPHLDRFQAVFSTFPSHKEYFTSDLYIKHPTKLSLWKYSGRADDVMALTTGEKINPINMEALIGAHPEVQSVVVVGQARFQTALLVEPREPSSCRESEKKFIHDLWPVVQKANAQTDAHARISRDLILLTTPEKPFLRAGKGTVQRRLTVDSYEDEINELYRNFENVIGLHSSGKAVASSRQHCGESLDKALPAMGSLQNWLWSLICNMTGWTHLNIDTDFFTLGMDSLQVLNIVRAMNIELHAAGSPQTRFTAKTIYKNPTVRMLVKVCPTTQRIQSSKSQDYEANGKIDAFELEKLISTYSWNMPVTCRPPIPNSSESIHVLLTGSTGFLGSYLLDSLLRCSRVAHIYCLNRSQDNEKRQWEPNEIRGLKHSWSIDRVTFFQSDLSQEYLGLQLKEYRFLLGKVTHILHNAWEVNFNLPLTSFETPHVVSIRQYIDFSVRSVRGASIFFVSSISSCMNWSLKHQRQVPESIIDDPSMPLPIGYAQSKYVAEQILGRAAEIAGIPVKICRVGQAAGPVETKGQGACWNKKEWLPSLIASSKHIGKIPRSLGPSESIDWIPVDILSRVLVELMEASNTSSNSDYGNDGNQYYTPTTQGNAARVHHAVNPHRTTWSSLLPVIQEHFGHTLQAVSLQEWLATLEKSATNTKDVTTIPAIKLLDFFQGLLRETQDSHSSFETVETESKSRELAALEAVKPEWMKLWLEQWNF